MNNTPLINFIDFLVFLPEIYFFILIIFLLIFLLAFSSAKNYGYPLILNSSCWLSIYVLVIVIGLFQNSIDITGSFFFNSLLNNSSLIYLKIIITFFTILSILVSMDFLKKEKINNFEYIILILLVTLGTFFFISSYDMKILYLSLEIQSLSLYILVTIKRNSLLSTEAGLKYFILGSLSSILLLFGFALIYSLSGTTNFHDLALLFSFDSSYKYFELYFNIGLFFILVGFLFKLAVVPFHMWAPDVYEGAPTSVAIFMSLVPKISFITVLIKLVYVYFNSIFFNIQSFLILCGILSIAFGSILGVRQKKIKRLIIYSSISHIGFILLGIGVSSSLDTLQNIYVYLFIYLLITSVTWSIYISLYIKQKNKLIRYLNDFSSLFYTNPILSFIFIIVLFSTAGIPPLIGFWIKYLIIVSAIDSYFILPSILVLFLSAISVFFYIRIVKAIYFNFNANNIKILSFEAISKKNSLLISSLFLITLFLIVNPNLFLLISYKISLFI